MLRIYGWKEVGQSVENRTVPFIYYNRLMRSLIKSKKKLFIIAMLTLCCFCFAIDTALAVEYTIKQLTNNSSTDWDPQIHNGQVVWHGHDGNDYEIYFYDGVQVRQLTNNNSDDRYPQIHNGQVVWHGKDGKDYEIYLYDGVQVRQLTNNNSDDEYPQIHNGQVVWEGWDGKDWEIYSYDGVQVRQLTNNAFDDWNPQIHNGQVVWKKYDGNDSEIYFYDGVQVRQLTNNSFDEWFPQIDNGQVVWTGKDGNDYDWEIFLAVPNYIKPIASIVSIEPNPAVLNQAVSFKGLGTDADGTVIAYVWRSSLDGQLSDQASFETSALSEGTHTIYLKVQDNDGVWSDEVSQALTVNLDKVIISGTVLYEDKFLAEWKPVRFAEIEIRPVGAEALAAGSTDEEGNYSLEFDHPGKIQIFLRCYAVQNEGQYRINVRNLNQIDYYSDSPAVFIDGTSMVINHNISDSASGAYSILDTAMKGSKFVTDACGEIPPLLIAVWEAGVGNETLYDKNTGILYINGDPANSDEFDDNVILREYGRFIANVFSRDESPGGPHNPRFRYDIRLSWIEGWSYFFSCAVRGSPSFVDNRPVKSESVNIENLGSLSGSFDDDARGQDNEIAVASVLWDIFDEYDNKEKEFDNLSVGITPIWKVFTNYLTLPAIEGVSLEDFWEGWFQQSHGYFEEMKKIFGNRKIKFSRDELEADDSSATAQFISGDIAKQEHTYYPADDVDWFSFSAQGGDKYTITTSALVNYADTVLEVYDTDLPPKKWTQRRVGVSIKAGS